MTLSRSGSLTQVDAAFGVHHDASAPRLSTHRRSSVNLDVSVFSGSTQDKSARNKQLTQWRGCHGNSSSYYCQEKLVRTYPGFSSGASASPDRGDLVPPPIVDGLSGQDVGLAAAQLVAAHSRIHQRQPNTGGSASRAGPGRAEPALRLT